MSKVLRDRWVADNPSGPSNVTRWHSREDCPSIAGIASHPTKELLEYCGVPLGESGKCRVCAKRDLKEKTA